MFKTTFKITISETDKKISKLSKEVTELKKQNPDKALKILDDLIKLEKDSFCKLKHKLRKVTIFTEHKRYEDALKLLQKLLYSAPKVTEAKKRTAENKYIKRIKFQEKIGKVLKDFEYRRSGNEHPDFDRNLYLLKVYSKTRTLYQKVKMFDQAAIFAALEFYSRCENDFHNEYSKIHDIGISKYLESQKDSKEFRAVISNLKKCQKQHLEITFMDAIKGAFDSEPNQDNCIKLLKYLQEIME